MMGEWVQKYYTYSQSPQFRTG